MTALAAWLLMRLLDLADFLLDSAWMVLLTLLLLYLVMLVREAVKARVMSPRTAEPSTSALKLARNIASERYQDD